MRVVTVASLGLIDSNIRCDEKEVLIYSLPYNHKTYNALSDLKIKACAIIQPYAVSREARNNNK
jgi:hypothetical protein